MKYKEYLRNKEKLRTEYEKNLAALETIWQALGEKDSGASKKLGTGTRGQLIGGVLQAAENCPSDFNQGELEESLRKIVPEFRSTSVSTALKRLVTRGALLEVKKGTSRHNPSIYRLSQAS